MKSATFRTIKGSNPILLSAPHVFPHKRPRLSRAYKIGELFTDEIVERVCKDIDSFGMVLTEESNFDPNYHKEEDNPYKKTVRELIKRDDIKNFVDIHGLKNGNKYDISITYPSKFSKSIRLAHSLKNGLEKGPLRGVNIMIFRFLDDDQETLGEFVASKLRVPSVQIEIARYIREKENLRDAFIQNLSKVLEGLVI
jgi:hypothetical protein